MLTSDYTECTFLIDRAMQEVQLDKHVKLLDCPGIVMASGHGLNEATAVLRNCIKVMVLFCLYCCNRINAVLLTTGGSCS